MTDPTQRALNLLGLLQARLVWTGTELAERLGVTPRSIRRDIDRLRELGYPVAATAGVGGGYQLGAGKALPPLLLDDEEAVAVAVCLRLAAGGTVAGVGESAVRTLAKLDQILPARLRHTVAAVHESTVTLGDVREEVDSEVLLTIARACRELERISFSYTASNAKESERRVEPYRLVATGRRWYLMAFDLDRDDWRTFRLDRVTAPRSTGWHFHPRPAPDPAAFVQRSIVHVPRRYLAKLQITAPYDEVRDYFPATIATVEDLGAGRCLVVAGAERVEHMLRHLAFLPWPMAIIEPEELRVAFRDLGERLVATAKA